MSLTQYFLNDTDRDLAVNYKFLMSSDSIITKMEAELMERHVCFRVLERKPGSEVVQNSVEIGPKAILVLEHEYEL